jgi:tetratricopeptide (TPR) repeat protein
MHAAKQGNYTLSYSIYTNLLHDSQYDYKLKSEILSSRATTLLFEEKYFESIDDCTQAIAFNQWNKFAYVVRGICWMIKHEYVKAMEDYSKLFHFFDQNQYVLDLLNLAYEKSIEIKQEKFDHQFNVTSSLSPTASFNQPAVYLCYPYQT